MNLQTCITRPLDVVQELFAAHAGANGEPDAAHKAIAAHFEAVLADPQALQQVPVLTAATADGIPSGTLVRLRGMVTDMLNPEYYLGAYRAHGGAGAAGDGAANGAPGAATPWRTTAFSDAPPADLDAGAETRVYERRALYVSRVPADSAWAEARWTGLPPEPQTPTMAERGAGKRARQASEEPWGRGASAEPAAAAAAAAATKQARVDAAAAGNDAAAGAAAPGAASRDQGEGDAAAAADGQEQQQQEQEAEEGQQQRPAVRPTFEPGDCVVYLHGEAGDALRLHDVVELVGVVSVVPGLAAAAMAAERRRARNNGGGGGAAMDVDGGDDQGGAAAMEAIAEDDVWAPDDADAGAHPPTSQALRVHAVLARRVPPREPPPRAPASLKPEELAASVASLRARALSALAAALGGDALAAEYVLAACCGAVHSRVDGSPHGHVHVNLTLPADPQAPSPAGALHEVLAALLPCVRGLPLTLDAVNAGGWAPVKDHASGRLARGRLQLPPGAMLVLDETAMAAGAIGEGGVRSLQALTRVLADQQLPVDFQFYQSDYPLDVGVVTVSRGRSLLRDAHHVVVPLQAAPASAGGGVPLSVAPPAELEALRDYLAHARALQCQLDEAAAQQLAAAFGDAARAEPGFTMDRFNTIVTLAKLLSLSAGKDRFEMSSWARAMELEAARRERVAAALRAAAAAQPQAAAAAAAAQPAAQQQA